MKTVDIKWKSYVMVNERLIYFREKYPNYSLETEVVELNEDYVVFKALNKDENGRVRATWFSREVNGDWFINKTSYIENWETSAWWRALANFAIWIDTSVASADEVWNAIVQKDELPWIKESNIKTIEKKLLDWKVVKMDDIYKHYRVSRKNKEIIELIMRDVANWNTEDLSKQDF